METYYDDSRVTLGDGTVDVEMGVHGVQKVSGSRSFVRDPRLHKLGASVMDLPPLWKAPMQMAQVDQNSKWCYICGDVRPKHYFSPHRDTYDKLDPRCKECESKRKRRLYAQEVGHPVRSYVRQKQAAG